ncbi:hypothetical protein ACQ4PT_064373 [Festuca glaucescens]
MKLGRRFHFEAFWPKAEGFMDTVQEAWNSIPRIENPFKRLQAKLRATARKLTSWSDLFIGSVKMQILVAIEIILWLDVAMETRTLSVGERGLRRILKHKLLGLASLERTIARQRARILWLKEGDACTRFFHVYASGKRQKNFVAHLKVNDVLISEHADKAFAVDEFYDQMLGVAPDRRHTVDLDYLGLPTQDLSGHEAEFTEEEVWQGGVSAVMFKLDVTKAFDTIDWAFLLEVLAKMGFGERWLSMIYAILSSAKTKVLLNGLPGDIINNKRGLPQGDPLPPMLFVKLMAVLNFMVQMVASEGFLLDLGARGLHHRSAIFADGVVTFLRPTCMDVATCAALVEDFREASGLRTNFAKCAAHLIRCGPEQSAMVQQGLHYEIKAFPCTYLGLPLGLRKPTAAQLQPLVEKAANKLPAWGAKLLNIGGRTELVKTTLVAMTIHVMLSLDLPVKTLDALHGILRGFMWKGRKDVKGGHCLVAWNKVSSPKENGGVGIPNLRLLNTALRCHWAWLQRTDHTKPWAILNLQVSHVAMDIFRVAMTTELGNGNLALF